MKGISKGIWHATLALLATAALGAADNTNMPPPGTLNYVEGQVLVQGQKQSPKSVGTTYLEPNQVLDTRNGNAEVLLTPGVYLRVGHNSEVKMISPGLADTRVRLDAGSAMVEVDELFKENSVSVAVGDATTTIDKKGLYDFDANPASVSVLDGKATVSEGDRRINLKKGREALLASTQPLAAQKLQKDAVEGDPLYRWSKLRSEYATESNVETANALIMDVGWFGPGWYWDPFWWDFAFLPGDGMFWGPFGYPFFSPGFVGWAPYYGYYGRGYGGYYRYPANGGRVGARNVPPLARQRGAVAGGFHTVPRPMASPNMRMRMGGPTMGTRMSGPRMGMAMGGFHGGFGHGR
jgi:hypothetical protein